MTPSTPVAALADLTAADPDRLLGKSHSADCADYWTTFAKARDQAAESNDAKRAGALDVLAGVCSLMLRADEPMQPFAPLIQMVVGSSVTAEAYRGAQADIFAEVAPTIGHPALRARIADLAWFLGRRPDSGRLAISSYLASLSRLLRARSGGSPARQPVDSLAASDLLRRACVIERQLGQRDDAGRDLAVMARKIRERARRRRDVQGVAWAITLELDFRLAKPLVLARVAERLASELEPDGRADARVQLLEVAARAYQLARRASDADRAVAAIAECHVRTADRFSKSPMHEAHWLEQAIAALKRFKGTNDRRADLQARLIRAQGRLGEFMVPPRDRIDVSEIAELTRGSLAGLDRVAALLRFAEQSRSPDIAGLRSEADKSFARTPFAGLFAPMIFDPKFKVASRLPAVEFGQPPDEGNLRHTILRHEELRRTLVVGGQIEPARIQIVIDHQPDERLLTRLASLSPCVPQGHERFFGRGFAHFFNADFIEAAHLLVLQLEPMLRHILASADVDTTRFKSDQTQASAMLSGLLRPETIYRTTLEELLGEEAVFEIENLFDHSAGPAIRHRIAHGLLSPWSFGSYDIIYACWFIYRLCVDPLQDHVGFVREHLET